MSLSMRRTKLLDSATATTLPEARFGLLTNRQAKCRRAYAIIDPLEARKLLAGYGLDTLGTFAPIPNGGQPKAGLVADAQGNLYGTTSAGGAVGCGTLFEIPAGTNTVQTIVTNSSPVVLDPYIPLVVDPAGDLFAVDTSLTWGHDSIVEIAAGTGVIKELPSPSGSTVLGEEVNSLAIDAAGNLFGTTGNLGANNGGIVFELPAGNNTVTALASLGPVTNGVLIGLDLYGGIALDANDDVFGVTGGGGSNYCGSFFELPRGAAAITTLASFDHSFSATSIGAQVNYGLTRTANGDLYCSVPGADGSLLELPAGGQAVNVLHVFDGTDGKSPFGGIALDAAGNLYGTTSSGGAAQDGTVYELPAGSTAITTLMSFDGSNGAGPEGSVVLGADGRLHGITVAGGTNNQGTVFQYAIGGGQMDCVSFLNGDVGDEPLGTLVADSSGNIFGTTSIGGTENFGTFFEIPAGSTSVHTLASFNGTDGSYPVSLIQEPNGDFYGATSGGGEYDQGTMFSIGRGTDSITMLASFSATTGMFPNSNLILDSHGNLYGTTREGVFEFANGTDEITPLIWINIQAGEGSLVQAPSGEIFGVADPGEVFGFTPGSTVVSLSDRIGSNNGLAVDSQGNVYGTTTSNTVFELPSGHTTVTTLASFPLFAGSTRSGGLIIDSAGNLFGEADDGVFELPAGSNTTTMVANLSGYPYPSSLGGLLLDAAGNIYGTTTAGGIENAGTIFRLAPSDKLAFSVTPTSAVAGTVLGGSDPRTFQTEVQVNVEDAAGNIATSDNSSITLTLDGGTFAGGATTSTVAALNGVATFDNLVIDSAGSYTIVASDGSLAPATSRSFAVNAAAPSQLILVQQPTSGAVGLPLSPGISIAVEDQFSNLCISGQYLMTVSGNVYSSLVASTNGFVTVANAIPTLAGNLSISCRLLTSPSPSITLGPITVSPGPTTTTASDVTATHDLSEVTVKAQVTNPRWIVYQGTVTFEIIQNGNVLQTSQPATVTTGTASGTLFISNFPVGTYEIRALYNPVSTNPNFATSVAAPATLTITQATTTVSLVANDLNLSEADQPLSFSATVSSGVPDGEAVRLLDTSDNNAVVATGVLSGGLATLTVSAGTLLAGTHNLIAVYAGDADFAASESNPYTQTVQVAVRGVQVNGDDPALAGLQRSMVEDIVYTFSEPVVINNPNQAFTVAVAGSKGTVPATLFAQAVPGSDGTQWAVSLTGQPDGVVASIANGEYSITINPQFVFAASDGTTQLSSGEIDTFYRLFGDVNGDRVVNALDNARLKAALSTYNAAFDANGDGFVNAFDNAQFKNSQAISFLGDG